MTKFMCTHTVPQGAFSPEQLCQLAEAAQHADHVRGYRSFFNLSQGQAVCVLEAEDRNAVINWFDKMGIPYDNVTAVEFEGERGVIEDLQRQPAGAAR
jgi:hypothetical protein